MATSGAFAGQEAALQSGDPFTVDMLFIGVPVNELLDLTVGFQAKAQTAAGFPEGGGLWESAARVDFDQTLSFATDRAATLPNGFTLNSPSGNITNNVWTPEPAPVPLPGTVALLASALLALARSRVRLGASTARVVATVILCKGAPDCGFLSKPLAGTQRAWHIRSRVPSRLFGPFQSGPSGPPLFHLP